MAVSGVGMRALGLLVLGSGLIIRSIGADRQFVVVRFVL